MFLVDTCGWIEWMIDSPLAKSYSRYLISPGSLIVPTLVQHELYKWLYREIDPPTALSAIAATRTATVISLDTSGAAGGGHCTGIQAGNGGCHHLRRRLPAPRHPCHQ